MRRIIRGIKNASKDENFLRLIGHLEVIVSKILSLAMIVVIVAAIIDLIFYLIFYLFGDLLASDIGRFNEILFTTFGLFLNILIALEILENITAYLRKHVVQVELVISTSLVAVARKIIILDLTKTSGDQVIGLGIAIFALSVSYWIVHRSNIND